VPRQRGRAPVARSIASGNFAGCAVAIGRRARGRGWAMPGPPRCRSPNAVGEVVAGVVQAPYLVDRAGIVEAKAGELLARERHAESGTGMRPVCRNACMVAAVRPGAVQQLEHRRSKLELTDSMLGKAWLDPWALMSLTSRSGQDVVAIGAHDQMGHRTPIHRRPRRQHVAEIAVGTLNATGRSGHPGQAA